MSSASAGAERLPDGRLQRTVDTRRRILDAARALLLEGGREPVARQVAERAGIASRTLFRHFTDMEALHGALVEEARAQAGQVMDEPFTHEAGDVEAAIELIIDRRVRVYESLLPLYVSRLWHRHAQAGGREEGIATHARRRRRLVAVLPEALREDRARFEALDATLGIEFWVSLRQSQGLDVATARDALRSAARCLLRGP